MDKLTISNMELYYGDFKALKDHGVYRSVRLRKIHLIKILKPHE